MSRGDDIDFDELATGIFTIAAGRIVSAGPTKTNNWNHLARHVIEATEAFMAEMQRTDNGRAVAKKRIRVARRDG